jgi:hypothetical protein
MSTTAQARSDIATENVLRNFWSMLPRRFFFDDMPDKGLFAGVATLGFILILFLKVEALGSELVCVLAVTLMLAYGVAAYHIPAVRLRLDRLGDNFYYLGFIYTLASLSAALVQMRSGIEVDAVLGNFGVALITTIVGIAGRVVFVQMRSEIDDVEEVIRRDILELAGALKGQLSGAIQDFDTFRTGLRQIATETLQESADYGKAHIQKIAAVAEAAAARINTAFDEKKSHAEELVKVSTALSAATGDLITRMNNAQIASSDHEKAHIQKIAAVAEAAAARINTAFDDKRSHAEELIRVNIKLSAAVDDLISRMKEADLPTEQLISWLNRFTSALEVIARAVTKRRRWFRWKKKPATVIE